MKAISMKPAGTASIFREFCERFSKLLTNFGLHIAVISTVVALAAALFDNTTIQSIAAAAALIAIYPSVKFEKGEEV